MERPNWALSEEARFSKSKISSGYRTRQHVLASRIAAAVAEGGEELRREKMKSVSETGAGSGGSGTGGQRLWNVIVLEQKPELGSMAVAI